MAQELGEAQQGGISSYDLGRAAALAGGALLAIGVENLSRQKFGRARTELAAAGLITAAAIYPLARKEARKGMAAAREMAGVLAATAAVAAAYRTPPGLRRRAMIGAAWASHALFDNVHDAGPGGRLPSWYPDACAGYDLAFAGALLRPGR